MQTTTNRLATAAISAAILATLASGPVAARHDHTVAEPRIAQPKPTTLSFAVTGEVDRAPDMATVSAGVVTESRSAQRAMQENRERMNQVFAAIRGAGIAERDIQTSGVRLAPQYVYEDNRRPRISGYQASNRVTIRVRDLKDLGEVLDGLVAAEANDINGPNFSIDDPSAALNEAREAAMAEAMARASLYANAAGMQVKRIATINESGGARPQAMPMMMARAEMAMDAAPTPVAAGEMTLSVTLTLEFELE